MEDMADISVLKTVTNHQICAVNLRLPLSMLKKTQKMQQKQAARFLAREGYLEDRVFAVVPAVSINSYGNTAATMGRVRPVSTVGLRGPPLGKA